MPLFTNCWSAYFSREICVLKPEARDERWEHLFVHWMKLELTLCSLYFRYSQWLKASWAHGFSPVILKRAGTNNLGLASEWICSCFAFCKQLWIPAAKKGRIRKHSLIRREQSWPLFKENLPGLKKAGCGFLFWCMAASHFLKFMAALRLTSRGCCSLRDFTDLLDKECVNMHLQTMRTLMNCSVPVL